MGLDWDQVELNEWSWLRRRGERSSEHEPGTGGGQVARTRGNALLAQIVRRIGWIRTKTATAAKRPEGGKQERVQRDRATEGRRETDSLGTKDGKLAGPGFGSLTGAHFIS